MKSSIALLALLIALCTSVQAATNTQQITLSSAEGGTKSNISWTFGGDILTSAVANQTGGIPAMGLTNPFLNSGYFTTATTFAVSGAGSFSNLTTGATPSQVNELYFWNLGANGQLFLRFSLLSLTVGNSMKYTPGTDSYTIDAPFAAFIPGTYTVNNPLTSPAIEITLTVVPEPATWVLVGFAALGLAALGRGKRK